MRRSAHEKLAEVLARNNSVSWQFYLYSERREDKSSVQFAQKRNSNQRKENKKKQSSESSSLAELNCYLLVIYWTFRGELFYCQSGAPSSDQLRRNKLIKAQVAAINVRSDSSALRIFRAVAVMGEN